MANEFNGKPAVDLDEEARHELARLTSTVSNVHEAATQIREATPRAGDEPFQQPGHDLLLKSIDAISTDWIDQLTHVRKNSEHVETLVLQRATKIKSDITALFLLGHAAKAEAQRGHEVNSKLTTELERLAEETLP